MKIGIVTDSCCDLPQSFLTKYNITILPITIKYGDKILIDSRDPKIIREFTKKMEEEDFNCESIPFSKEQIKELFLEKLILEFDYVICITVASTRSLIYENIKAASLSIISEYKTIREANGINGIFNLRFIDSQQLFCGQAIIVAEVVRQLKKGVTPEYAMAVAKDLSQTAQTYLLPSSLTQMRSQARKKGDKSVGLMSYVLGSTFDIKPIVRAYQGETTPVAKIRGFEVGAEKLFNFASEQIKKGLKCPHVCISFGGDPEEIKKFKGFKNFLKTAAEHKINIIMSEMSTTAIVNIGPGGLCIGFASDYLDDI